MSKAKSSGFTLIELLIAISILSLLLFIGSFTYSMLAQRWEKELGEFTDSAKDLRSFDVLQRVLNGIVPLVIRDKDQRPSFFFVGSSDSLLGITQAGIFSDNYPEIFRITALEKANGSYDLVYQSISVENIILTKAEQSINFNKQITLLSELSSVHFNYYGWNSIQDKNDSNQNGKKAEWTKRFSGIDTQLMPERIILSMTKQERKIDIPVQLNINTEKLLSAYYSDDE
jgi:prepilin-type N-terminal cleavage/methylation domain-containing protein